MGHQVREVFRDPLPPVGAGRVWAQPSPERRTCSRNPFFYCFGTDFNRALAEVDAPELRGKDSGMVLVVRDRQLRALESVVKDSFVDKATALVAHHFPRSAESMGPHELRRRVREALEQADEQGMTRRTDALRYLSLTFALGPNFVERHAWAREIVGAHALPADVKLDILMERAVTTLEDGEAS